MDWRSFVGALCGTWVSGRCDSSAVEWMCTGAGDSSSFADACQDLGTALIRYGCPPSFLSACP